MQYTTLGRTGLRVSRVGLGAGGPSRLGRSRDATLDDMDRLIGRALDLGVNFIDTARTYGTEDAIGRALQGRGAADVIVATKVWLYDRADGENPQRKPHTDPRRVIDAVEESLRDLRRDRIDLFQYHGVPPASLDTFVEHLLPVAERLREQGKVRFIGLSEQPMFDYSQEMATRACASGLWDSAMVQYGIFDQAGDTCAFPPARANGTGVICMSAARGALVSEEALARTLGKLHAGTPDDLRFPPRRAAGHVAGAGLPLRRRLRRDRRGSRGHGESRTPRGRRPGDHRAAAAARSPEVAARPLRPLSWRGLVPGVRRRPLLQPKRRGWKKAGSWKEGSASSMGAQVPQWGWEVLPPHL